MALDESFWGGERELLYRVLYPLIFDAAVSGAAASAEQMYADFGIGVDWALVNDAARRWAQAYTTDLVRRITDTSRAYVRGAIADWIAAGAPLDDLVATLTPMFGRVRAQMIAATEVTRAYAEASRDVWQASGVVDGMRWMTAEDELVCPVCGPLAGTVVALNGRFASGFDVPPAHVRCRCWLTPVVNTEKVHGLTGLRGTRAGRGAQEVSGRASEPATEHGAGGERGGAVRALADAAVPAAVGDEPLPADGDAGAQRDDV